MGRIWEFGAHLMTSNPRETELRRRWYQAHVARFEADTAEAEDARARQRGFAESAVEALALRDQLARNGHVEAFRAALQEWAVKPGTLAFNGYSGQMFVNQLVKRSGDHAELARILASALVEPADDDDAVSRMRAFTDYVESIRLGAHPAPGHSGFLLSYFWGLANHRRWPVLWASGAAFVEFMAGETLPPTPADRYGRYLQLVRELDDDHARFESVAAWWERTKPVFLDPVLAERCTYGRELPADAEARAANAAVLVSVARHLGNELVDPISRALGRSLAVRRTRREWPDGRPRADLTVDWTVEVDGDLGDLGLRLWLNQDGVAIGLRPGAIRRGWYDEVAAVAEAAGLPGFRLLGGPRSTHGDDVGFESARPGEFVYGRWWSREQMADLDVRAEAVAVAAALQPTINELIRRATGEEPPAPDDPLGPLVEEFRTATGYPTPADEEHKADRQRFAALLAKDAIGLVDPTELARIWTTRRYGNPGPQSVLNTTLRDADPAEYDRILDSISYLCWGEGEDADRIDDLLDPDSSRYVRGLGESVIMKFLAITRPERYLPVFPYSGPNGKRRMLAALGLDQPSAGTRGQVQVEANDRLRKRLDRFFPNDPRGMARFLYWYVEREEEAEQAGDDIDPLAELAEQVLVDRQFLDDIVALLEDKGQVIFYGPPGTGKTYLARKLAEALAPDPTRRSLVQFHPSTSYEDFFEGYRPEVGADGQMTYRLVPGPLAQIAARAADAPGKRHVMIIDEINRANLPKVLGELLFLFEYRGEQVRTLYRPDDAFELPANLWFIGTMNTADRSIALVDAALRRRFHFVPFFPGHGPMAGLLERWLERHGEPDWVGELVAMVNDELAEALDGPHLQLGPSHFMKRGLDVTRLRRIWEYNVEPFIEDQFFGDRAQIDRFRFDAVVRRYQEESGRDIGEPTVAAVSDLADDLGVPAPGEGDGSAGAMDAPTAESPAPTTPDIADGGP